MSKLKKERNVFINMGSKKNKDFFYQQYDKINWANQEETKLNLSIYKYIINNLVSIKKEPFNLFEIGSGIGFFIKMLKDKFGNEIEIEGCEPSKKSYDYFIKNLRIKNQINIYNKTFQNLKTSKKFNFITSIYVFPHFVDEDLPLVAKKINSMLKTKGKFILVVSNEKYLRNKLRTKKDLFIEQNIIKFKNKKYKEYLHYVEIPGMGTVIDYDREEKYYRDLLEDNGLKLINKNNFKSDEYICTIFVFEKK